MICDDIHGNASIKTASRNVLAANQFESRSLEKKSEEAVQWSASSESGGPIECHLQALEVHHTGCRPVGEHG